MRSEETWRLCVSVGDSCACSLLNLLDCFFSDYRPREGVEDKTPEELKTLADNIEPLFLFAFVWSVCATVDKTGRRVFDSFLRSETAR